MSLGREPSGPAASRCPQAGDAMSLAPSCSHRPRRQCLRNRTDHDLVSTMSPVWFVNDVAGPYHPRAFQRASTRLSSTIGRLAPRIHQHSSVHPPIFHRPSAGWHRASTSIPACVHRSFIDHRPVGTPHPRALPRASTHLSATIGRLAPRIHEPLVAHPPAYRATPARGLPSKRKGGAELGQGHATVRPPRRSRSGGAPTHA
jgi:hypothetical protein